MSAVLTKKQMSRTGKPLRVSDYPEDVQIILRARAQRLGCSLSLVIGRFNREMIGVMSQEVKKVEKVLVENGGASGADGKDNANKNERDSLPMSEQDVS